MWKASQKKLGKKDERGQRLENCNAKKVSFSVDSVTSSLAIKRMSTDTAKTNTKAVPVTVKSREEVLLEVMSAKPGEFLRRKKRLENCNAKNVIIQLTQN